MRKKYLKSFFCCFIGIVFIQTGFSQLPQFESEKITITILGDLCEVEGLYFFKNNFSVPIKTKLYYPFALDSSMLYPDLIKVYEGKDNRNISFINTKGGMFFPIEIPPGQTQLYKVHFTQRTTNNCFEYILTTTRSWSKPLENAKFIIKLPLKFEIKFLSYEYNEKIFVYNYIVYIIDKENFMPQENLIVEWAGRLK